MLATGVRDQSSHRVLHKLVNLPLVYEPHRPPQRQHGLFTGDHRIHSSLSLMAYHWSAMSDIHHIKHYETENHTYPRERAKMVHDNTNQFSAYRRHSVNYESGFQFSYICPKLPLSPTSHISYVRGGVNEVTGGYHTLTILPELQCLHADR